ncbi:MAG TPA: TauD/TfdA family dioxygenase [Xanthobacteraceae bacterium]
MIAMPFFYSSGEEIRKGDRVLLYGEPGEIELVANPAESPDDWFVKNQGSAIAAGAIFAIGHGSPVGAAERSVKPDVDAAAGVMRGIGTHLGRGLSQSVMGDRLGHVKDFSREDPGARAYRNKQELSPHTDSCDLAGLLCLRDAQAGGGVSRLTSAISVHNTLLAEHPDVLAALPTASKA